MAKQSFDTLDIGLFVLGIMSAFIVVGIGHFDLFGVDFGATMTTLAGFELSTAWVLSAAALVGTIVTNDNTELSSLSDDIQGLEQNYMILVVGTIGLLVAWVVFPQVATFFQSADLWGLIYVGLVAGGQFVMGWML